MSEQSVYGAGNTPVKVRTHHLQKWKTEGHKWSMLTAYDYSTARIFDEAGIPVLLVGDSAANVVYGYDTTVPVTTDEMIPLRQELDTLQSYLRIQRMRYGERFALSVLVPEELTDLYVPKLILQPLVENAVFHGFSDGRTDGLIVVEGRLSGSMLLLSVADNGVGMTPELARSILDEQSPEARRHHKGSLRSIGLRNTQDRIRLRFGDAYGLDVISQEGMGTMVTVSLPPMTQADLAKDMDAPGNGLK